MGTDPTRKTRVLKKKRRLTASLRRLGKGCWGSSRRFDWRRARVAGPQSASVAKRDPFFSVFQSVSDRESSSRTATPFTKGGLRTTAGSQNGDIDYKKVSLLFNVGGPSSPNARGPPGYAQSEPRLVFGWPIGAAAVQLAFQWGCRLEESNLGPSARRPSALLLHHLGGFASCFYGNDAALLELVYFRLEIIESCYHFFLYYYDYFFIASRFYSLGTSCLFENGQDQFNFTRVVENAAYNLVDPSLEEDAFVLPG